MRSAFSSIRHTTLISGIIISLFLGIVAEISPNVAHAEAKACAVNSVVRIASDTTYPPFENIDTKTNQPVGFDIDLLMAMGRAEGFTPQFVTENFDTIFTKLSQGDYDLVVSAVTITDDRSKIVNFSNPYFQSSQSIAVRQADTDHYRTLSDLQGLRIGVQKGTTGADLAATIKNAAVSGYDLAPQVLQALANKDVDAVVIDSPVALNLISSSPTLNLAVTKNDLTDEKYGIAVRKECGDLLNKVNAGLQSVIADGTYNTLYRQYFGQDAPAAYMPANSIAAISAVATKTPLTSSTALPDETSFNGPAKTFNSIYGYSFEYYANWPTPIDSDRTKSKSASDNQTYLGSDIAGALAATSGLPVAKGTRSLAIGTLAAPSSLDALAVAQVIYNQAQTNGTSHLSKPSSFPINGFRAAYVDLLTNGASALSIDQRLVVYPLGKEVDATILIYAAQGEMDADFAQLLPIIGSLRLTGSPGPTAISATNTPLPPTATPVIVSTVTPIASDRTFNGAGLTVAFSPDGQLLASSLNALQIWNIATGKIVAKSSEEFQDYAHSLAFSPDGRLLAYDSGGKTIWLRDISAKTLRSAFTEADNVLSIAFSPNGKLIASANGNIVRLWDIATGQPITVMRGHTGVVYSVAFSPDGTTLLTGSQDKTVILWNVQTGSSTRTFTGYDSAVYSVAFAPDGNSFASVEDKIVQVRSVATGQLNGVFTKGVLPQGDRSVAFSPDGHFLASASDSTVQLWNLGTKQRVAVLSGHANFAISVAFSPDGRALASGGQDNTVQLWDISDLVGGTTAVSAVSTNVTVAPTATPIGPASLAAGTEHTDSFGIKQVYVPAGCFLMGSTDSQAQDIIAELVGSGTAKTDAQNVAFESQPQHQVCITKAYWVDEFDVTNAAFDAFVKAGGYADNSLWSGDGLSWKLSNNVTGPSTEDNLNNNCTELFNAPNQPRVCVNYYEAEAYARWRGGRLPTEAEWEYTARSTDGQIYPWAGAFDKSKANTSESNINRTTAVDAYPAGRSWVGAYDMAGNVFQWVSDWSGIDYYKNSPKQDPTGPSIGITDRMVRGGSFASNLTFARSAFRFSTNPTWRYSFLGFRAVVVAVPGPS